MSKKENNKETISISIDNRVDSDNGYIETNVVSCCKICNFAKGSMSYEDFQSWIQRLIKNK